MKIEESKKIKENAKGVEETLSSGTVFPHVSDGIFVRNGNYYCKILYIDILWLGHITIIARYIKRMAKPIVLFIPLSRWRRTFRPIYLSASIVLISSTSMR